MSHYLTILLNNLESETVEEMTKKWVFLGGESNKKSSHYNTLKLNMEYYENLPPFPEHRYECECSHPIKKQEYVYNQEKNIIKVVGSCCINRFMDGCNRRCPECKEPHKGRKNIICKKCLKSKNKKSLKDILAIETYKMEAINCENCDGLFDRQVGETFKTICLPCYKEMNESELVDCRTCPNAFYRNTADSYKDLCKPCHNDIENHLFNFGKIYNNMTIREIITTCEDDKAFSDKFQKYCSYMEQKNDVFVKYKLQYVDHIKEFL